MNEAKDGKVSDVIGEGAASEGAAPATVRWEREGRDAGETTPLDPAGGLPRQESIMKVVLRRAFITVALFAVCVAILAATKTYGVWVLSGIAVVLFVLGLLRKDKKPAGDCDGRDAAGDGKEP